MRAVVQRVTDARVSVDGDVKGSVGAGMCVLLGVEAGDGDKDLEYIVDKVSGLRIFDDENGVMNRSILDTGGEILSISQFTLLGDVRHGKRPSWIRAERPEEANDMYMRFNEVQAIQKQTTRLRPAGHTLLTSAPCSFHLYPEDCPTAAHEIHPGS